MIAETIPAPSKPADREVRITRLDHGAAPPGSDPLSGCPCPPGVALVGRSRAMALCLKLLHRVARSGCNPVLLTGETGVGKELAARAVHVWRCGTGEPFVAVNCATLTRPLLESELCGHVKGAFTGADRAKTGLLELAGRGTVFLDEIGEVAPELQAKLLRIIQERRFRKVGGTVELTCSATIVASSNRDLLAEAEAGRFRSDLYYRLAVFPIHLPPLRAADRRADIPLLAKHFVENSRLAARGWIRGISRRAEDVLLGHNWPGNVRELRNVIERAMILESTDRITPESIVFDGSGQAGETAPPRRDFSLKAAEREFILRALKETGWQRTRAASLLGITRATLHAKLKRHGISPPGPANR